MANFSYNYMDYGHSPGYLDTQAGSGDALSNLALSAAAGNVAGGAMSFGFNRLLQENQFENQKELQDRSFRMNERSVAEQARLQALGMQNAGLSPAQVQGSGAPSIQAGAAAGATAQMTNIFAGLAELIGAIKAPSEVEKNLSEASLASAGAEEVGTRVEQYNDYNDFMKRHAPSIIRDRIESLKSAVVGKEKDGTSITLWDQLADKTRATLEDLADGKVAMSVGAYKALMDDIEGQKSISNADYETLLSGFKAALLVDQMNDPEVWKAMVKDPQTQLRSINASISTQRAQRHYMSEQEKNLAKEREKMDAEISGIEAQITERMFQLEEAELHDIHKLWNDGRYDDVFKRLGLNATQEGVDFLKNFLPALMLKRGLNGVKVESPPVQMKMGTETPSGIYRPNFNDPLPYKNFR